MRRRKFGVQLSLNAYITNYYPTSIRGTGVGWSQVVGRFGSLAGPLVGGALVSQGMTPSQLFQISSIAPLLACASLLAFAKFSTVQPKDMEIVEAIDSSTVEKFKRLIDETRERVIREKIKAYSTLEMVTLDSPGGSVTAATLHAVSRRPVLSVVREFGHRHAFGGMSLKFLRRIHWGLPFQSRLKPTGTRMAFCVPHNK